MTGNWLRIAGFALFLVTVATVSQAQEYTVVESPFGEEFDYTVPDQLSTTIEVDHLRFSQISIAPKGGKAIVPDKLIPSIVTMQFENTADDSRNVVCVVMLEDKYGRKLERITLRSFKVGGGKSKEFKEKLKIDGTVLQMTAKLFIFIEVSPA